MENTNDVKVMSWLFIRSKGPVSLWVEYSTSKVRMHGVEMRASLHVTKTSLAVTGWTVTF